VGTLKRIERRLTGKLTRPPLERFLRTHASGALTLDLGSSAGFYAALFPRRVALDIRRERGVHVVGNALALCFPEATFDTVLCTEVLEHLPDPQRGIDEMFRVLRDDGTLLLTTRFLFPIHDAPGDFFRYTRYGLQHLLRRFDDVAIVEEADPMGTLAILVQRLGIQADTLGWRPLRLGWHLLAHVIRRGSFLLSAQYGDARGTPIGHPFMTSGYYVRARRPRRATARPRDTTARDTP
jgi:SAM-dependent methyltransferase